MVLLCVFLELGKQIQVSSKLIVSDDQTCKNTFALHNQGLGQKLFTREKHMNCRENCKKVG